LVETFQKDDTRESAGDGVLGLSADEADLLEASPVPAYVRWVVPLTVWRNNAADKTANDD
jgi:hypothetical protein